MDWTKLHRTKAPADTVISLAEAKAQLRVYHNEDDALINSLIAAATDFIEGPHGIGIALLSQDWVLTVDQPMAGIEIDLTPVQAVTSITVDGETADPADYSLENQIKPAVVNYSHGYGVAKVHFTAGYGDDADDVPEILKTAVKLLVTHYYIHRGDSDVGIPLAVKTILARRRTQF